MAFNRPLLRTSYEQEAAIFPTYTQKGLSVAFGVFLGLMGLGAPYISGIPELLLGPTWINPVSNMLPLAIAALGINIKILFRFIFSTGACFAGVAGMMLGPITAIQPGMGEPLLILSLVVIIIGGIGSVRGAFIAAIIVGLVDTLGRIFLPAMLRLIVDQATADGAGPALASMLVYILMAVVLIFRPTGLFPAKG